MEEARIRCLTSTKSPFVLEGLKGPVKWWGWCEEAFESARREDKPVLVDVGAVWCHWCHVMDETTYSDPEVAELINAHFVPIKVDRDERPDVDRRLQEAAQLLVGQAGWPLTVFLTPDGDVIWAATYLPPRDGLGLPGMPTVLRAALEAYRERRGDIRALSKDLARALSSAHGVAGGEPDRSALIDVMAQLASSYDEEYGGFGGAPKFPPVGPSLLLAARAYYDGSIYAKMLAGTLDAMAKGGVYDHLLGGFFRYSTDREWVIPHYEKLLVDNAELMWIYSWAYAALGRPRYRGVVEGVGRWLDEFMADGGGGYYASQDADVEGEEGGYYRWSREELESTLGDPELYELAARHFGIYTRSWPEGKATLYIAEEVEDARIAEVYRRLSEHRRRRTPPRVDKTIIASWNCATALGEIYAARYAGVPRSWRNTIDRVMSTLWDGEVMWRAYRDGVKPVEGFLEDYAYCALAALEAFSTSGEARYLRFAAALADSIVDEFHSGSGAFKDVKRADGRGILSLDLQPLLDTPNLSPNSLAILALDRLYYATGVKRYREAADSAVKALYARAAAYGAAACGYFSALDSHMAPPPKAVVTEPSLLPTVLSIYRPWLLAVPLTNGALELIEDPSIRAMARGPGAVYVCTTAKCTTPLRDKDKVAEVLRRFGAEEYALS